MSMFFWRAIISLLVEGAVLLLRDAAELVEAVVQVPHMQGFVLASSVALSLVLGLACPMSERSPET